MSKSSLLFFCGFIILIYYFRLAESQEERSSVCLLENAPVQCGAFCSSLLFPVYDHNRKIERQWNETQKKLDRLEEQLLEIQKALAGIRLPEAKVPEKVPEKVTINSRQFFIEKNILADWETSENACNQMGGHLATFQSQEEFDYINAKLDRRELYWLGIHNGVDDRTLRSVSNGKRAKFIRLGGPFLSYCQENRCSFLMYDGRMFISQSDKKNHYICQADEL
ncbi:accessory gland protein Acp29AB-like [Drosophila takahashii]|uniref:accessory gland protein Acp29AB-like n=1 Tax=Drosophila takahashii TaxID=29030 RepID=UPI0038994396